MGRLLFVEDDTAIAGMYALALRGAGWEVEIAGDGRTGLAAIVAAHPDAVILDMALPELSGAEVLQSLRHRPSVATIPVLVLSNADRQEWRSAALRFGGRWLVKSRTTPSDLVAQVQAEVGPPGERRRQPRRLDDILQALQATTASSVSQLPLGAAAALAARGIDLAEASSIPEIRRRLHEAAIQHPVERERRRRQRRRI